MFKIETGGPAFPNTATDVNETYCSAWPGMALRDYFAAKAMAAYIHENFATPNLDGTYCWSNAQIAEEAYYIADAMLSERL